MRSLQIAVVLTSLAGSPTVTHAISPDDQRTLAALKDAGSDLAKAHEIRFWLYFSSQVAAAKAAAELKEAGYRIDSILKNELEWRVLALKLIVPSEASIAASTDKLSHIATTHHGEYDGWEAQVVE